MIKEIAYISTEITLPSKSMFGDMFRIFFLGFLCFHITLQLKELKGTDVDTAHVTETFTLDDTDYIFFSTRVSWDEANIICPSYGGRLASPINKEEAYFLSTSMASSDFKMEIFWLGARKYPQRQWAWVDGDTVANPNGIGNYPFWKRTEFRTGKDCMALFREHYSNPVFADLDCRLLKPFICEKETEVNTGKPIAVSWVKTKQSIFVLYRGRVPWNEAVVFCRAHGMRLAVLPDAETVALLKAAMTRSRPAFENVWISGHRVRGKWYWLPNGQEISHKIDKGTKYPPWAHKFESTKPGCLIFDKHACQDGNFLSFRCEGKQHFVCEEFTPEEVPAPEATEFECGNSKCALIYKPLPWYKAQEFCETKYEGRLVVLHDRHQLEQIVWAMIDHPREIEHIWVDGHNERGKWRWSDMSPIPPPLSENDFPPWCAVNLLHKPSRLEQCLNLDRTAYKDADVYGMLCNTSQPFICDLGAYFRSGFTLKNRDNEMGTI